MRWDGYKHRSFPRLELWARGSGWFCPLAQLLIPLFYSRWQTTSISMLQTSPCLWGHAAAAGHRVGTSGHLPLQQDTACRHWVQCGAELSSAAQSAGDGERGFLHRFPLSCIRRGAWGCSCCSLPPVAAAPSAGLHSPRWLQRSRPLHSSEERNQLASCCLTPPCFPGCDFVALPSL